MLPADLLTLGELVRRQRLNAGWTQAQLAGRLSKSIATVSKIETDQQLPGAQMIPSLASELRIDRRRIVKLIMQRGRLPT